MENLILLIAVSAILIGWWKIFIKAGYPGWAAFMPIYNLYILVKIAKKPGWWTVLLFIPIVNFITFVLINLEIARNFGKTPSFGLLLALVPFISYLVLGFSDDQYIEGTLNVGWGKEDWSKVSLEMLSVNIALIILVLFWYYNAEMYYSKIYQVIKLKIPFLTQFILSKFPMCFFILALVLIVKEFLKDKKLTFIINIVIFVLIIVFARIGVVGLYRPLLELWKRMR